MLLHEPQLLAELVLEPLRPAGEVGPRIAQVVALVPNHLHLSVRHSLGGEGFLDLHPVLSSWVCDSVRILAADGAIDNDHGGINVGHGPNLRLHLCEDLLADGRPDPGDDDLALRIGLSVAIKRLHPSCHAAEGVGVRPPRVVAAVGV